MLGVVNSFGVSFHHFHTLVDRLQRSGLPSLLLPSRKPRRKLETTSPHARPTQRDRNLVLAAGGASLRDAAESQGAGRFVERIVEMAVMTRRFAEPPGMAKLGAIHVGENTQRGWQ